MINARWAIAGIVAAVLIGLLLWQRQRHALIENCSAAGGVWNGENSKCIPVPGAPVLQRDLRRT